MIKDYFMAIKAKHDIKSKEKSYKNAQKKALLSLLNRIVSIYNEKEVTSGSITLDNPMDIAYFRHVKSHVYDSHTESLIPGGSYRSITKWGIIFKIKLSYEGRHVEYHIEAN